MNRTTACFAALLFGVALGAACGGKVVVDGSADAGASSTASGQGGAAGTGAAGGGSTGGGGCDAQSHTLDPTEFNLSCTVAADCASVYLGDFCASCRCPFSAINVADTMKYEAKRQMLEADAPTPSCFCPASTPTCAQGQCATNVP